MHSQLVFVLFFFRLLFAFCLALVCGFDANVTFAFCFSSFITAPAFQFCISIFVDAVVVVVVCCGSVNTSFYLTSSFHRYFRFKLHFLKTIEHVFPRSIFLFIATSNLNQEMRSLILVCLISAFTHYLSLSHSFHLYLSFSPTASFSLHSHPFLFIHVVSLFIFLIHSRFYFFFQSLIFSYSTFPPFSHPPLSLSLSPVLLPVWSASRRGSGTSQYQRGRGCIS